MPQVDFYNLPTSSSNEHLLFVCRLINKAWQQVDNTYIHCNDETQRQTLNQLLWQFKPESFIPHDLLEENANSPITLGLKENGYSSLQQVALFVNLTAEPIKNYHSFSRIVEFVINDPQHKENARHNYRFYQQAQLNIKYHR